MRGQRQSWSIDAQKIAYTGFFQTQKTRHPVVAFDVDDVFFYRTEDPGQHIVEMYSDISRDSAAFGNISFPVGIIPIPAGVQQQGSYLYLW